MSTNLRGEQKLSMEIVKLNFSIYGPKGAIVKFSYNRQCFDEPFSLGEI